MKKYVELNGKIFEYNEKHFTQDELAELSHSTKKIFSCYSKPSQAKISVYNEWKDYYNQLKGSFYYGIISYNVHFFSLLWIIEEQELFENPKSDYVVKITPTRNYITRVI